MPGETSNNQTSFNKQEVSLYAHLYEKYIEIKNVDGTVEMTPDKYNWNNGSVVLEYVDYRSQPTCMGKRILLRQDTASLWDDILRINQDAGGTWTQEMAIQVESKLLLAMHPVIDLDPNSTLQGLKRYDPADGPVEPVHRELKTRKRKLNSYELEQEAAKKAKKEQMMFMMDERHGREFKPTFKLLPYFKKNKISATSIKKLPRKFVRQLMFERDLTDDGGKWKLFTLLTIYQESNGKYEALSHTLNEKDLRAEGRYNNFMQTISDGKEYKLDDARAKLRNEFENTEIYKAFIKSFIVLYSIDNTLKYDSERTDKVPVEMLAEVTTELTNPQTAMKFDNMQPYEIIELLAEQSDAEMATSSNEGSKDLSVADLYNAAAKKAMQSKPPAIVVESGHMSPPQKRRRSRQTGQTGQTLTTQSQVQVPTLVQNVANPQLAHVHRQTPVQQIPQTQIHQPRVMASSQSPSQRPIQSPVLNYPVQIPQSSTDGTRPIQQQIPIPVRRPIQQVQLVQGQMIGQHNVQMIPNIQQIIPHATQLNARSTANQGVTQETIQNTITSPTIVSVRKQSQQMNVPMQQHTSQISIPPQTNSSQMNNQVMVSQINIPTQPTDIRVNSQLQSPMNHQVQQINIPVQVSNVQQAQQMSPNQTQSTPQINIPVQVSDPRIIFQQQQYAAAAFMGNPSLRHPSLQQVRTANGLRQINPQFMMMQPMQGMQGQMPGQQSIRPQPGRSFNIRPIMRQNIQNMQSIPNIQNINNIQSIQNLQNIQNMQNIPNMATMHMNPQIMNGQWVFSQSPNPQNWSDNGNPGGKQ